MKFRWLIRGFAIALLTLCLSCWGWSYLHSVNIEYDVLLRRHYWLKTHIGGIHFGFADHLTFSRGWRFTHHGAFLLPEDPSYARLWGMPSGKRFLGFYYDRGIGGHLFIAIPFWFPSLLSAGLLWFAWRKTRPKMWRGFPVEVPDRQPE